MRPHGVYICHVGPSFNVGAIKSESISYDLTGDQETHVFSYFMGQTTVL